MRMECIEINSTSRIKIGENGKFLIIRNPDNSQYSIGNIDGCIITEGIRADKFISNATCILIAEFKGTDVNHACSQLFSTLDNDIIKKYISGKKLGFLIVCTRYPRIDTKIEKAKNLASRLYKAKLTVVCNKEEGEILKYTR